MNRASSRLAATAAAYDAVVAGLGCGPGQTTGRLRELGLDA